MARSIFGGITDLVPHSTTAERMKGGEFETELCPPRLSNKPSVQRMGVETQPPWLTSAGSPRGSGVFSTFTGVRCGESGAISGYKEERDLRIPSSLGKFSLNPKISATEPLRPKSVGLSLNGRPAAAQASRRCK
jgi:hypothetical protein